MGIYFGSTNVQENQLTTFLVTANELKILGLVETSNLQKNNVNHSPGNSKNDTIGIGANDHITIDDTENGITEQQQEKLAIGGSDFVDFSKTPTAVSKVDSIGEVELLGQLTPNFNQNERIILRLTWTMHILVTFATKYSKQGTH